MSDTVTSPADFSVEKSTSWANQQAEWAVLLGRIARGDQRAMAELYDHTSQVAYSLALRMLENPADAEEVTMDVYSQIWRSADRYTRDRGTVFAWIVNITRTRAIDLIRARRTRNKSTEPLENADTVRDSSENPEQMTLAIQQHARVREAVRSLPEDQRRCIDLAFFGGLTHSELAERLGEPLGTVKTRIRSGMIRLRSAMGDLA